MNEAILEWGKKTRLLQDKAPRKTEWEEVWAPANSPSKIYGNRPGGTITPNPFIKFIESLIQLLKELLAIMNIFLSAYNITLTLHQTGKNTLEVILDRYFVDTQLTGLVIQRALDI